MNEIEQPEHQDIQPEHEQNESQLFMRPAMALQFAAHEGPLPHPSILQGYEKLCPGAADRILRMTEIEQQHRIDCEKESLTANIHDTRAERAAEKRGQWQAFGVCMTAILSGVALAFLGAPLQGALLSGGTMLGVVAVFITRKKNNTLPATSDE